MYLCLEATLWNYPYAMLNSHAATTTSTKSLRCISLDSFIVEVAKHPLGAHIQIYHKTLTLSTCIVTRIPCHAATDTITGNTLH